MDFPRDGEMEAAEADHQQVDEEAGDGDWQQLTEDSEVIVAGPAGEDQSRERDGKDL